MGTLVAMAIISNMIFKMMYEEKSGFAICKKNYVIYIIYIQSAYLCTMLVFWGFVPHE